MADPVRLRLSRARGFDLQAYSRSVNGLPAIVVARPGPLGNPFVVGRDGDAARCVELHRHLVAGHLCLTARADLATQRDALAAIRRVTPRFRDHNVACWCRAGAPCHGDTYLMLARICCSPEAAGRRFDGVEHDGMPERVA